MTGGGRADIHFHLLPGVDDGPRSMEESVELARLAEAEGTRTIVATPHVRPDQVNDVSDLPERTRAVRERLAREGIHVAVEVGAELGHMMVARMLAEELETVALGPPGRRWLLDGLVVAQYGFLPCVVKNLRRSVRRPTMAP